MGVAVDKHVPLANKRWQLVAVVDVAVTEKHCFAKVMHDGILLEIHLHIGVENVVVATHKVGNCINLLGQSHNLFGTAPPAKQVATKNNFVGLFTLDCIQNLLEGIGIAVQIGKYKNFHQSKRMCSISFLSLRL